MSGEPPVIDLVGGPIAELVQSATRVLSANPARPMAVIGGLAVTCRCRTMVRGTGDIDAVTGPEGAVGIVCDLGAEELGDVLAHRRQGTYEATGEAGGDVVHLAVTDGHLYVNGVKVDVIDTHELTPATLKGLDEQQQLFLASHRWALESAELAHLRVAQRSSAGDIEALRASLAVATPEALVAMKLHSLQDRRQERPEKEASDTEDLYRLLREHDARGEVADGIARAPYGLPALVLDAARRLLLDNSLARIRNLRVSGGQSAETIADAEFRFVTEEFVSALERSD